MSWFHAFEHAEKLWGENATEFNLDCCGGSFEPVLAAITGSLDDLEPLGEEEEVKNDSKKWTSQEDDLLSFLAKKHKENWGLINKHFPSRTAEEIEKRWTNKLNPSVKRGKWSPEEDQILIELYGKFGRNWKLIAKRLGGRRPDSVKNRFYGYLRERITKKNQTLITAYQEHRTQNHPIEALSINFSEFNFDGFNEEEKRKKLQELYYEMTAIEASISKTNQQIKSLKNKTSKNQTS